MLKKISKKEFIEKIKNKDGDFKDLIFDFNFNFSDFIDEEGEVNFEINFSGCIFEEGVSFSKVRFSKSFFINNSVFKDLADFYASKFFASSQFRKCDFMKRVNFNLAHFSSDMYLKKTTFFSEVYFKKARFNKNFFIIRTDFFKKIDFSYAHFSNDFFTSFSSININKDDRDTFFIFRNIYFPDKTIFNNVDLSKSIFKNSIITKIIFKDCNFSKAPSGRDCFYAEIAKRRRIKIKKGLNFFLDETVNTLILPDDDDIRCMNIGDIFSIESEDPKDEKVSDFFIVSKFNAEDTKSLDDILGNPLLKKIYHGFTEIICHSCVDNSHGKEKKIVAFRLKKFNRQKHWEVLEDNYRQMKKSLEESKDWQKAGEFYRGEMFSKIKILGSKKEQFWYRFILCIYRLISQFGESTKRVLLFIIISTLAMIINLSLWLPHYSLSEILNVNISLILPVFGSTNLLISSLNLEAYQNVIIQIEVIWFYLLWLILAIAARRRFKR